MQRLRFLGLLTLATLGLWTSAGASTGPDDRPITDPKSVTSTRNPNARSVPLDDLYYTRNISGPAWSPDGKEIVFTSDLAGRTNLWKVSSSGGWPLQLTQSDDRRYGATWSPDGKWIVYQQDTAGNEMWDLYAIPGDGGEPINLTNTTRHPGAGPALVARRPHSRSRLQDQGWHQVRHRVDGLEDPHGSQAHQRNRARL